VPRLEPASGNKAKALNFATKRLRPQVNRNRTEKFILRNEKGTATKK
jgi:hypothetical protein